MRRKGTECKNKNYVFHACFKIILIAPCYIGKIRVDFKLLLEFIEQFLLYIHKAIIVFVSGELRVWSLQAHTQEGRWFKVEKTRTKTEPTGSSCNSHGTECSPYQHLIIFQPPTWTMVAPFWGVCTSHHRSKCAPGPAVRQTRGGSGGSQISCKLCCWPSQLSEPEDKKIHVWTETVPTALIMSV